MEFKSKNSFRSLDKLIVSGKKYHFFNSSRQTRLLGRWVKLSKMFNQKWYLNFIDITKKRLINGLKILQNNELILL